MNIGINCYNVNPNYKGGINTYTFGLLDGFAKTGQEHQFYLFLKESNKHLFEKFRVNENFKLIVTKNPGKFRLGLRGLALLTTSKYGYKKVCDTLYKYLTDIINSTPIEILYSSTTFLFPYKINAKTIISLHDIQHVHYPFFFSKLELLNRKIHLGLSSTETDYFQASSEFIKEDLSLNLAISIKKIFVIHEGVEVEAFSKSENNIRLKQKYLLPEKFLFYPAQLWPHKNHITLLKALRIVENKCKFIIPLILTGAKKTAFNEINTFIKNNNMDYVNYLGLVPFEDLIGLYQSANYVVSAGLYESSSLPVLEACAASAPIIASEIPPNIEMSKTLEMNLFDPLDDEKLADLLVRLWNNVTIREKQIEFNNEHIHIYSWNNVALKYYEAFSNMIKL